MGRALHRLQVSLPHAQVGFLRQQAAREGVSMASAVRALVASAQILQSQQGQRESIWEIAGIAEDKAPLIHDVAVSERPEIYLTHEVAPPAKRGRARHQR